MHAEQAELVKIYRKFAVQCNLRERSINTFFGLSSTVMASHNSGPEARNWSHPLAQLNEHRCRSLLDNMAARPRPRFEIDEALRNVAASKRRPSADQQGSASRVSGGQ